MESQGFDAMRPNYDLDFFPSIKKVVAGTEPVY